MRQVTVVVPTNRPERLPEFREAWDGASWSDVAVVYDGPGRDYSLEWPEVTI
jgi:hypothetical protein